jgi:hypothetical protein
LKSYGTNGNFSRGAWRFSWGFLKDTVYRNNLHTDEELKQKVLAAASGISKKNSNCSSVKLLSSVADGCESQWCI